MRTSVRTIVLATAIGTAAIAAPVVSIGGTAPVSQASAAPSVNTHQVPIEEDRGPACPPGSIPLGHSCGYPLEEEDGLSPGEIGVVIVSGVFILTFGVLGL